jgi:hypothetical protein
VVPAPAPDAATVGYQHGPLEPSEHTTVVLELGGTTTVVDFSGGAGLLLLMHADNPTSMHSEANTIFIMNFPLRTRVTNTGQPGHFDHLGLRCLSSVYGTGGQCHPTYHGLRE